MPKKLEHCATKLMAKGHSKSSAYAICNAAISKGATDVAELEHRLPIAKLDQEQGITYFWVYRTADEKGQPPADISGEVVLDPLVLEKASHRFMSESRRGDILHVADAPCEIVSSLVVTDEVAKAMGLPEEYEQRGWLAGAKWDTKSAAWAAIKKGELPEVSFKGRAYGREIAKQAAGAEGGTRIELFELEVDTIGFVDKGDNRTGDGKAGAPIIIVKRAEPKQEESMSNKDNEKKAVAKDGGADGTDTSGDGAGPVDLLAVLKRLLEEQSIDADEFAAFSAAMASPAPPAEPMGPAELAKRAEKDPVVRELLKRAEKAAEIEKRLDEADARAELLGIEKRARAELPHLPESAETVAGLFHELRKAQRFAIEKGAASKSEKGKPDVVDRLWNVIKALGEQVDTAALYGEGGANVSRDDDDVDAGDDDAAPGDVIHALAKRAIAKSAKDNPKEPLSYDAARAQVFKEHPKLARRYLQQAS